MVEDLNSKDAKSTHQYKVDVPYARNNDAVEEIQRDLQNIIEQVLPRLPKESRENIEEQFHSQIEGLMEIVLGKDYAALTLPLDYKDYKLLEKAQRLGSIEKLMRKLIDDFSEEGIEIFPRLIIEGLDYIDLFIRFPSKVFFVITVQNIGDNTLFYSMHRARSSGTQRGGLYLKSSKGSSRTFRSKKLDLLPEQEKSIRKQYRNILGGTAKDARSGMNKIIAVCGKEAKMTNNFPSELTEKHGERKFYLAQKNPGIFIMQDKEIPDFIKTKIKENDQRHLLPKIAKSK